MEKENYLKADSLMPAGRTGRTKGIFASPSLGGVGRWVQGNSLTHNEDIKVRELRVNIDTTYVYSVNDWEAASSRDRDDSLYDNYWKNGISFREYMTLSKKDPQKYNPKEWEILLSSEQIRSVKPVGRERVAEQGVDEEHKKRLLDYLK